MRTNVTFSEIVNEVYKIFSDDRQAAAYMADSFGPQYIGLCGWAGAMSPANRAAFVQTFGRDVTDRAEAEARARVREYRAAVAASAYHLHELEADTFAAYGDCEKSLPEVGAFVWGCWSCLKGEGGPLGELEDLERMDQEGRENPRRLCEVVAVVDADPSEFLSREYADNVARQFQELGGSCYEETDPRHLDGRPMSWELVFCVRCGGRWYMIDGQGYGYSRYFLMPEDFRQMYAPELATITAAREDEERRQKEEEQRQAEARRADYLKRCARWAPLMEDVRPLMEADRAAYGDREKSRKTSAKLAAARRRNLVAMASALFTGVQFSAKKWDGWGGSYELAWTDGPTEEHLEEAADFHLFESGRDTFDGMTDCAGVSHAEFADFANKYFGLFGEIKFNRRKSEEFKQSICDRIRAAVPGLPEGDQERITDGGQLSAVCGLFPDVCASYIVQNLERYGLRDAVAYIARCIDATPTQDEPTDPNGGGSPAPSYGDCEKSPIFEKPAAGLQLVDIAGGGVAVTGDSRATYKARKEIKSHGATWNKAAKQWEAHNPAAVASLREWFGVTVQDATPEAFAPVDELPAPPALVSYDPAEPVERAEFHTSDEVEPTAPTEAPTPSDGATGAAYGTCEKSPVPESLAALYEQAKTKRPDAVALFRCCNWFTAYGEDADKVAQAVGIIVTVNREGYRLASFPAVALDSYLPRMVRQGMAVCICEVPPTPPTRPTDPAGTDGSHPATEGTPTEAPTPTDGATGAAYGNPQKSQNFEDVAVSIPDVKEYKLMYLFGAWVGHSRVYAETDAEAIQDATDDYITSCLPRWPYRVALWEGSRLVHVFKEDGPDDIGRRDMEQEESENAPAYIVHDTTAGPFAFEDYATGSILAAVAYIHRNISVDNPHQLELIADGVKVWDSEDNPVELAYIVRQRLAVSNRLMDEEGTPSDSPKGESCDADGAAYGDSQKSQNL